MAQTSSGNNRSGGRYRSRKKGRSGNTPSPVFVAVIIFLVILLAAGGIYMYVDSQSGTIADNISLAGVNIGGMTQAEAVRAVNAATEDNYATQSMVVTVLDSKIEISPAVSGVSLDVKAAVKAAFRIRKPNTQVDATKYISVNEAAIRNALKELGDKYSSTLSQTTYEVTGTAPNQSLIVTTGVPEYALDMNLLYNQLIAAYADNTFSVVGECGLIEPEPLNLQSILDEYYIAPIDATLNYETYDVIDSVDGYGFDIALAEKQLEEAGYGKTIKIPFMAISPEVTTESLKSAFYKDVLATYTAKYSSDANRDVNLRLACQAINGKVLFPGEAFSYNKALGERTEAKGYKPGPSFSGGKTVDTIGGGICQVSSALYYCAMKADMGIGSRENHGYAVSYVPLGMDAAVSWDTLDFTFVNTSNLPIRIEASASGGDVTVSIVGTDDRDYYVELQYEVLSTEAYETVYKSYPPNNPEGYTNGMYLIEPHTGYSVQTYRCKYDKETNNLISQVAEAATYYAKSDAVICIIEGDETEPTQGIGNGGVTEADGALP